MIDQKGNSSATINVHGEYLLRVEHCVEHVRVSLAKARTRPLGRVVSARVREIAEANGALIDVEEVIDGEIFMVAVEGWPSVLAALASAPPQDPRAATLTRGGAQRAVLARLAAAGGQLPADEVLSDQLEAECFPLDYLGRDAVVDLVSRGNLKIVRRRGMTPIFVLTSEGLAHLRE